MMLEFRNIIAAYHQDYPILDGVCLEMGEGEKIALLGRNGAGKTTFANTIFNNVPHISGDIMFKGENIVSLPLERRSGLGIGYFMQGAPVFPQLNIKENLRFAGIKLNNKHFSEKWQKLRSEYPLLKRDGIDNMPAGSLSGGERSQLCLAMVLLNNPALLVLDEPFAGLSPGNTRLILQLLSDYQSVNNASVILIAQDRQLADEFCDKQYFLRNGKIHTQ